MDLLLNSKSFINADEINKNWAFTVVMIAAIGAARTSAAKYQGSTFNVIIGITES